VPTPRILACAEWESAGVEWHAVMTSLVSSPTIKQFFNAGGSLAHDDRWVGLLRDVLGRIAALPTDHRCFSEQYVANAILARFGRDAPRFAAQWQTAHGDLNWKNLTAPDLVVFDWETWGLAPRAYDAAYLMVHLFEDIRIMERLEREYDSEFATESGCVGLLVACAEMLNFLEASGRDSRHSRNIEAIAERALRRHSDARRRPRGLKAFWPLQWP
jgi:hypothetical protein